MSSSSLSSSVVVAPGGGPAGIGISLSESSIKLVNSQRTNVLLQHYSHQTLRLLARHRYRSLQKEGLYNDQSR